MSVEVLTAELAQQIVRRVMAVFPYSINIMDSRGVIIASGRQERVGQLHLGAKRAIDENRIVVIDRGTGHEERGTNEPIVFEDEVIGVVGITGDPEEVSPFTKLVRTIVQLILEEQRKQSDRNRLDQQKRQFIADLVRARGTIETTGYPDELVATGLSRYGLDLTAAAVGLLSPDRAWLSHQFPSAEIFVYRSVAVAFVDEAELSTPFLRRDSGLGRVSAARDRLLASGRPFRSAIPAGHGQATVTPTGPVSSPLTGVAGADESGPGPLVVVSRPSRDLGASLSQLWNTYVLSRLFKVPAGPVWVSDHAFYASLLDSAAYCDQQLLAVLSSVNQETRQTLLTFMGNNMHIQGTSDALHIHRNTLHYRLQQVERLTGRDPTLVQDLAELVYHLALAFKQDLEAAAAGDW